MQIGSVFEYVNQKPVFGIINSDSIFYAPLLGFFAFTGIPTAVSSTISVFFDICEGLITSLGMHLSYHEATTLVSAVYVMKINAFIHLSLGGFRKLNIKRINLQK